MLHIQNLSYRIGERLLLENADVHVHANRKVGLIGPNGAGKSTLLRLIRNEIAPETGSIAMRPRARLGHLAQEAPGGQRSLIDTVLDADTERSALLAEAEHASDPHRIAEIHIRLGDIQAHTAPARASRILAGLGFDDEAQKQPCDAYSGGWRMRVALAAALFGEPDLLLLDEPSNYLDLEATIWLESFLRAYPHTLLIVSHDRALLNNVVDEIIHLEDRRLVRYRGNYDTFERTRREHLIHQAALRSRQEAERRHIESFVERFRAKASKARQAQSRLKMLERMQPVASVIESRTPSFHFPDPQALSSPLITLENVSIGYTPGKPVLSRLDLRLDMEDRIALLGANGNGKSTFAKFLVGRLKAESGTFEKSSKLRVGYFAQHQVDELVHGESAFEHLRRLMPLQTEAKVRAALGRFGFAQGKADTKVGNLSGGEKARLLFCLATRDAPHLLILDEPTNHLDVDSREALVSALNEFQGAVLLISHDPHLVGLVADELWRVENGRIEPYDSTLDDYRTEVLSRRGRSGGDAGSAPRNGTKSQGLSGRERRQLAAQQRAAIAHHRKAAKEAEAEMARLVREREKLEAKLADPSLYGDDHSKVASLNVKLAALRDRHGAAEERWLTAMEAVEAATGVKEGETEDAD
ncbi:ABC-F family ATP-binding cassette domain-containing protein [Oceanibacterium hippocampi]|uniref:Putative ABC transporter ATP-binding protein YheS n=1 Tax=Oceanibacterium hippocampi TaxID=745714 RepID=A0A1Y5SU31_9PROT|nr:ABC-F family ATP-binding cassette domain-containing protein [Oceanibacterium hippocampi]SLN48484.1 putative ABC transporter ATP-binding protein YheS [Oceanibacterium hippocampi]